MNQLRPDAAEEPLAEQVEVGPGGEAAGHDEDEIPLLGQHGRAHAHEQAVDVGLAVDEAAARLGARVDLRDLEVGRVGDHPVVLGRGRPRQQPAERLRCVRVAEHEVLAPDVAGDAQARRRRPLDRVAEHAPQDLGEFGVDLIGREAQGLRAPGPARQLLHRRAEEDARTGGRVEQAVRLRQGLQMPRHEAGDRRRGQVEADGLAVVGLGPRCIPSARAVGEGDGRFARKGLRKLRFFQRPVLKQPARIFSPRLTGGKDARRAGAAGGASA